MMVRRRSSRSCTWSFSLDAPALDVSFVRGPLRRPFNHTGQPWLDPVVLLKLWLLGYVFNITSERRLF